jgi:hypothetical protein
MRGTVTQCPLWPQDRRQPSALGTSGPAGETGHQTQPVERRRLLQNLAPCSHLANVLSREQRRFDDQLAGASQVRLKRDVL